MLRTFNQVLELRYEATQLRAGQFVRYMCSCERIRWKKCIYVSLNVHFSLKAGLSGSVSRNNMNDNAGFS